MSDMTIVILSDGRTVAVPNEEVDDTMTVIGPDCRPGDSKMAAERNSSEMAPASKKRMEAEERRKQKEAEEARIAEEATVMTQHDGTHETPTDDA